jgi:hypothetical protein
MGQQNDRMYGFGGLLAEDAGAARQGAENGQWFATGVALGRVMAHVAAMVEDLKALHPPAVEAMQREFGRLAEAFKPAAKPAAVVVEKADKPTPTAGGKGGRK